jgi:mannose-6-phosphate isomerase-like protein (cupin superfamily)
MPQKAAVIDRQIDNERVRVTSYSLVPGAAVGFHRHEHDYVIVPVTSGTLLIKDAEGERTFQLDKGRSYFRPAGVEHDVVNAGDGGLTFIEVEILATA